MHVVGSISGSGSGSGSSRWGRGTRRRRSRAFSVSVRSSLKASSRALTSARNRLISSSCCFVRCITIAVAASAASLLSCRICAAFARSISCSAAAVPGLPSGRGLRTCAPRTAAWMRIAASFSITTSHSESSEAKLRGVTAPSAPSPRPITLLARRISSNGAEMTAPTAARPFGATGSAARLAAQPPLP